ncbi:hypothetical protein K3H44_20355, partial [Aeromonas veronii]|uniref:hypothetical protein n=1 Tax=Aeromonas veronii TaxID=654 RepID=UPI001F409E23
TIRAINWRWITKKTLKALMYCINPLNFFKLILRLFKWAIYIVFGAIALGMLTLAIGNYANAAESVPAPSGFKFDMSKYKTHQCDMYTFSNVFLARHQGASLTLQQCLDGLKSKVSFANNLTMDGSFQSSSNKTKIVQNGSVTGGSPVRVEYYGSFTPDYYCPPADNPKYTVGPVVTDAGVVCQKAPLQCLLGSVKDFNAITGKEFCRPICEGIAGNTYGTPDEPVSYFTSNFGSVKITCYGQCSVKSVGGAINLGSNPNVWTGVIQFTGENCPIQTSGNAEDSSTAGSNTPVTPPGSSDSTNNAQNNLDGAVDNALGNTTSGATGTATLNDVVNKIAETSNKEIKATSEQNAAMGKVIQEVGKDIQKQIYESQLASTQGSAGASMGQIQTANAIKDGNAQLGTKLDAIKDAIEKGDEGEGQEPLPPGDTNIKTDPNSVNPNPNDWGQRNYGTVMQHHVTAMNQLPLFSSIGDFFKVDMGAGTCPQFSIDVPDIGGVGGGSLVFDVFCNADLQKIFEIISLCVKLLGLYAAFRIALLD